MKSSASPNFYKKILILYPNFMIFQKSEGEVHTINGVQMT